MEKSASSNFKQVLKIFVLLLLVIILISLIVITTDNKNIKNIKEFTAENTKVLYITNKNKYSKYITDLFEKYDAKYLYIDSSKLSNIDKNKLKRIVNTKTLLNLIVIFENGEIKGTLIDNEDQNSINKFLQDNDIIPEVIGDNKNIISSVENLIETDYTLLYIPYKYINGITVQNEILENVSNKYNINYKMINAYLLSNIQKQRLNSILNISSVDEQIVILVHNKKIVGNIRGKRTASEFIDKLSELKFITEEENKLKEISEEELNNILDSKEKSIVLIEKNDCKYCSEIEQNLNSIIDEYQIDINYINIGDTDSELFKNVANKLKNLNQDIFTPPMTVIVESGKVLNNIIGLSTKEYFVETFKINGIIK